MLDVLCKLLGIREDQAEDALKSERAARHALSRRSFFGAAGMLTAGTVFSFGGSVAEHSPFQDVWREPSGSSLTTFDALLKSFYSEDRVTSLVYGANAPLLSMLERRT